MNPVHLLFVSCKRPLLCYKAMKHLQVNGAEHSLPPILIFIGDFNFFIVSGYWHLAMLA